jgi:soluble lytic murein transglycosylase-like protein
MLARMPIRTVPLLASAALCSLLLASAAYGQEAGPERVLIRSLRTQAQALENGEGTERDGPKAAALYCRAAQLGDAESQFSLGWMYANGRGVERSDSAAAFFFHAAAEQGFEQAARMLQVVGGPPTEIPACMQAAVPPPAAAIAAAPATVNSAAPQPIVDLVTLIAPSFKVQPALALAIIEAESNFDSTALSARKAMGLMQLIPATAERFNVNNPYDPRQNIRGGMAYLRWLLAYFEGDVSLVAAAYNAGERTVERYRGVPPYAETRAYVRRILRAVGQPKHPFDAAVTAPSASLGLMRGR